MNKDKMDAFFKQHKEFIADVIKKSDHEYSEDLMADCMCHLLGRLDEYDESKADIKTFIAIVTQTRLACLKKMGI